MILDTMTLEELILEIKTDFKEVRGRWTKFLPKFKKIIQKRTRYPWLWDTTIKTRRYNVSIPSTPFFYIKKALADFVYQLKPLLITQRKSFCNCREATSRSPLRSDRLGGAVRFP